MEYKEFLNKKHQVLKDCGFTIESNLINSKLFDYQADIVKWALKKGRAAIFADTGLGKTIMQCEWANHVSKHTNKPVLILAPLCISEQTQREAKKILDMDVTRYSQDLEKYSGVYVTNYEQIRNIDFSVFGGIILDESSILKGKDSKTRLLIIESISDITYRLSLTATPAPNDYMEFGSQAEFLGIMSQESMWATFFIHDSGETSKWRLKGHSQGDFWEWVSSWAVIFRKPSDIGHPESDFVLPEVKYNNHVIDSELDINDYLEKNGMGLLGRNRARRDTIEKRVAKCIEIVSQIKNINPDEPIIIWCHLNDESKLITESLRKIYSDVAEVTGTDKDDKKKDGMNGFTLGKYSILVTKPKIAGFGMNWQHCANAIFVGLNDSYESLYQAVRRCYRFGQKRDVNVHIISSDIESAVIENINEKEQKMIDMYDNIMGHMTTFQSKGVIHNSILKTKEDLGSITKDDNFEIYNGDCIDYAKSIESDSIDYSVFSPPFASLYTYSDSDRDMGNNKDDDDFYKHFGYFLDELYRIMAPGRLVSIHCMNLPTSKVRHGYIGIRDFRGELIREMQKRGFIYASEVTVWKCPVVAMQRTKALGLLWKQIKKDSAMNRQGIPDYVITFRKPGENTKRVEHTPEQFPIDRWQDLAQPTWQNIRQSNTLNFRHARDDKDERHICPLQLDLIERCLDLWTSPGDTVFSPFTGVGSEGVVALDMGRKFKGSELKNSYYNCAVDHLKESSGNIKKLWPCDPPIYDKSDFKPNKKKEVKSNVIEINPNQQNLFDYADKKALSS
jgi:DNA modification methylase